MVKTREFGQPCAAPEPGRCRICGLTEDQLSNAFHPIQPRNQSCLWADETKTLCISPACIAAARAELVTHPDEADELRRPYEGKRYGFAPRGRR